MKKLNKLLLAIFVVTASLFIFSNDIQAIEVNCSSSGPINVSQYVAPKCDGICPSVGSSSIGDGFAHIGNVNNYVEWMDDLNFKQHSNEIHFLYEDNGKTINLKRDTIWGGANDSRFYCKESGKEAFYQEYSANGKWGHSVLDTKMSCGDIHTSAGFLKTFEKQPSMETDMSEGGFNECTVPGQSNITFERSQQLIFQGKAICNDLNPIDVIITTNLSGAGAAESFVYCKGYGLCAWYQSIDFEENSPADWDEDTDVCALDADSEEALNRDEYYVEPIDGMYDFFINGYGDPGGLFFDKVYEDLVAQGYQAYCSVPNLKYLASGDTNKYMLEDIIGIKSDRDGSAESEPGNRITVTLEDYKQFYNYIDAQTPIWRKKGIYVLKDKDSLEAFWSHKNTEDTIGFIPIDFSPAYAVTTPEEQCREKFKILEAVNKKCSSLQNPETCALDISYTPGSMPYWQLYKAVKGSNFECSQMNTPVENMSGPQLSIKNNILKMPFAMPTSYRYAFAVYSAELREPRIDSEVALPWSEVTHKPGFDFLRYADDAVDADGNDVEPNAKPRSEVRILAFLIPDFATNQDDFNFSYKPPPENNYPAVSSTYGTPRTHEATYSPPKRDFHDALKIARNALQKPELQDSYDRIWKAKKERETIADPFNNNAPLIPFEYTGTDAQGEAFDYDPNSENKKLIECLYWNNTPTDPRQSCTDPLERAVTTFINRRIENPEDCRQDVINWEENQYIYDKAGIKRGDAPMLHLYNGGSVHDVIGASLEDVENRESLYALNMLDEGLYPTGVANIIPNKEDTSAPPLDDIRKHVFEFRFLSHYSFSSFYDGNDPIYRNDPEPPKDENTTMYVYGYLVYPVGYELEAAQDTFINAFLTPQQAEQFQTEFEEEDRDIWFKLTGIVQSLEEMSGTHPSKFYNIPADDCAGMYNSYVANTSADPILDYSSYADEECKSNPGASIISESQSGKEPRILGAKLGLVTIKLQQTLRSVGTPSWEYITSCLESSSPTEDFLTGRCSGIAVRDGKQDKESEPETDYLDDEVAKCNGGSQVINSAGSYTLPPSNYACSIDDSIDSGFGSGKCNPNDPDLVSNCAQEYSDSKHGIDRWKDSTDRVKCTDEFYSFVACAFSEKTAYKPSLIAHLVDSNGKFTRSGNKTACEYVQDRAAEQEVSPRLALSVWLEESGGSAYSTSTGGADFGVVSAPSSRESGSIEQQLRLFLGTINSNRNIGYPRFLLQYSAEFLYGVDPKLSWREWKKGDPVLFCRNRAFAGRLKSFYEQLGSY